MSDPAALERRYRRMLIWFPAEHRRIYAEEMIGVLLASASGDESRPGLADMTDIALWGLRTRLRGWLRAGRLGSEWGDALAAFAVVAPLLMTALTADQLYLAIRLKEIEAQFSLSRHLRPFQFNPTAELTVALLMLAATVATVAALAIGPVFARRRQRRAVTITAAVPLLLGAVAVSYYDFVAGGFADLSVGYTAFFVTEVLAVVLAPDPGRGWRVLTRKGLIIAVAVGAVTAATEELLQHGVLDSLNRNVIEVTSVALGIALILIFGSTAHKRMLALLAIIAYPVLASSFVYNLVYGFDSTNSGVAALYLPTLAIAVLVGLAIWQSSRQRTPGEVTSG